jgi:hypothetical protein
VNAPRFGWSRLVYQRNGATLGVVAAAIYDHHARRGVITLPADALAGYDWPMLPEGQWPCPSYLVRCFPETRRGFDLQQAKLTNAMSSFTVHPLLWINASIPVSAHLNGLRPQLYLLKP